MTITSRLRCQKKVGTDRCDLILYSFPAGPVTGIRFPAAMIVV